MMIMMGVIGVIVVGIIFCEYRFLLIVIQLIYFVGIGLKF